MKKAHFIVSTVEGTMITLCGEYISTRNIRGAKVGLESVGIACANCHDKVEAAWVTFVAI